MVNEDLNGNKVLIEVDEVALEDLILLGEDKLINILVEYPQEDNDIVKIVKTKAKIKQLTLKELKNVNLNNVDIDVCINILRKALFQQDGTAFTQNLILALPVGVCFAITREIMKISGVDEKQLGF